MPLDRGAERSSAWLRLIGAIVVGACAMWLVVAVPSKSAGHWLIIGIALLVAAIWAVMFARARRRLASPERHELRLEPEEIVLIEGKREARVRWEEIERIGVDEDRLVVRIEAPGRDPLVLEPRYGGLGVYDLEGAVRRAYEAGRPAA